MADVNQWRWLEESGQWLEIVDGTRLVLARKLQNKDVLDFSQQQGSCSHPSLRRSLGSRRPRSRLGRPSGEHPGLRHARRHPRSVAVLSLGEKSRHQSQAHLRETDDLTLPSPFPNLARACWPMRG